MKQWIVWCCSFLLIALVIFPTRRKTFWPWTKWGLLTHTHRPQTQGTGEPPVAALLSFSMVLCGRMLPTPTDTSSPHAFITTAGGVYLMPPAPPLLHCLILLVLNHQPVNSLDHITALQNTCISSGLLSAFNWFQFIIHICMSLCMPACLSVLSLISKQLHKTKNIIIIIIIIMWHYNILQNI